MPLYADDALKFVALHGFYDTVCGTCGDAQLRSGIAHALMVERIDREGFAQHLGNDAVGLGRHAVCRCVARCLLRVFEDVLAGQTGCQVLIERTAQRRHNDLEATTDAQHRYAAVVGQAYQHKFHEVALGVDAVELGDRLFAKVERIDVGPARDDQTVNMVEDARQQVHVFRRRDDIWNAASVFHTLVVRLGQFAALLSKVAHDANQRMDLVVGEVRNKFVVRIVDVEVVHKHVKV